MNTPQDYEPRASVHLGACLDATTRARVDELAHLFHRTHGAVLSYIMQWGLSRGPWDPDRSESQGPVRHLYLYVASDVYAHVEKVAAAAGVKMAPWLRHMVRQLTIADFPAS